MMKKLLLTLGLIYSSLCCAENLTAEGFCTHNGINFSELITFEKNLVAALKASDANKVAEMINYPLCVNSDSYPNWIKNKAEFIQYYKSLFTTDQIAEVLTFTDFTNDQFCSWRGASFGRFWINDYNGQLKIYLINYGGPNPIPRQPYGTPVANITESAALLKFERQLRNSHLASRKLITSLKWGDNHLYFLDKATPPVYIITYLNSGSGGFSGIQRILYLDKNNKLKELDIDELLTKSYQVNQQNWFLNLNDPFVTYKSGNYYLTFFNNGLCTYKWNINQLTFAQGTESCMGYSYKK
jgi:hypothetical protein